MAPKNNAKGGDKNKNAKGKGKEGGDDAAKGKGAKGGQSINVRHILVSILVFLFWAYETS